MGCYGIKIRNIMSKKYLDQKNYAKLHSDYAFLHRN